jgi:RIO kinase 1
MSVRNNKLSPASFLEDDVAIEQVTQPGRRRLRHRRQKVNEHQVLDQIQSHAPADAAPQVLGTEAVFNPTFTSSFHERSWILNYLGAFYDDKQITDVLSRVKGGKEANVYCCVAHPATGLELIAAKIYRPRQFRQLRNDARYRQGRSYLDERGKVVRDERLLVAVKKNTSAGQELAHNSWLEHEFQTLKRLHEAGVDVPRPIARGNNTILMEYLGDASEPAPALVTVELERDEARTLFDRITHDVELMLQNNCVHADLSAFNILYWDGDIRIIDLPQAVNPYVNPQAFPMFERDVMRVCQYFHRYSIDMNPRQLAREMWKQNVKRDWTEVFLTG